MADLVEMVSRESVGKYAVPANKWIDLSFEQLCEPIRRIFEPIHRMDCCNVASRYDSCALPDTDCFLGPLNPVSKIGAELCSEASLYRELLGACNRIVALRPQPPLWQVGLQVRCTDARYARSRLSGRATPQSRLFGHQSSGIGLDSRVSANDC